MNITTAIWTKDRKFFRTCVISQDHWERENNRIKRFSGLLNDLPSGPEPFNLSGSELVTAKDQGVRLDK